MRALQHCCCLGDVHACVSISTASANTVQSKRCCMHQQWRARCTLRVCSRRRRTTKRSLSVFLTTSICADQFFWTDVLVMPRCDLSRTARLIERASLWAQRRRVHAFFRSVAGAPLYWYVFWRIQRLPLSPSWGWTATHAIGPPGKYELHII